MLKRAQTGIKRVLVDMNDTRVLKCSQDYIEEQKIVGILVTEAPIGASATGAINIALSKIA
jgi:hypothetical protein